MFAIKHDENIFMILLRGKNIIWFILNKIKMFLSTDFVTFMIVIKLSCDLHTIKVSIKKVLVSLS